MVDHFSKWVEAVALPDQTAESAARAVLSNIVSRFGVPKRIHSDCGSQFESIIFSHLCEWLKINKSRTTPYHPMGNGLVERTNRTLKEMLRQYVNQFQNDWDQYLDLVLMGIRVAKQSSTGYSPSMLIYGREIITPSEMIFEQDFEEPSHNYHVYVEKFIDKTKKIQKLCLQNSDSARIKQKSYYDKCIRSNVYSVGDRVFLSTKGGGKLSPLFEGPFVIKSEAHPTYIVYDPLRPTHERSVHHNLLFKGIKLATEPRPPHVEDDKMLSPRRSKRKKKDVDYSVYF
ncbi:Retrovirus-related Pol polyprotein [Thelohanellus kitauei]|uniref:Retrovirus-related Pol polyprotein n=1 Tax=Thelohanellus kitauei TaxID=669202 RepID=A0A0C2M596_THEKT|nr:Retrovirus-related Pol polyprotein [Thelohanellus kitauei]